MFPNPFRPARTALLGLHAAGVVATHVMAGVGAAGDGLFRGGRRSAQPAGDLGVDVLGHHLAFGMQNTGGVQ